MARRLILALVVLSALLVATVPALSAAGPKPEYFYYDACSSGAGCSMPGPGTPGGCNDGKVDCCSMYQTTHVHDMMVNLRYAALYITYTPGFVNGCTDTVTVWVSAQSGPCTCPGGNWVQIGAYATVSRWIAPGQWKSYAQLIRNPNNGQAFRCVRIDIPACYNDGSMAVVVR